MPSDPIVRKSPSRVLVTGATGFLGRAVADALTKAGHQVLRGARSVPAVSIAGERWIGYGEVGPKTRWEAALAGVDVIVHLAGLAHLPDPMAATATETFTRVNADGTARLASAAVEAGICRLVLVSSALVHGETSRGRPFTEDDVPAPASPYARSKLDSERRLVEAAQGSALEWVILRPPMVYGAGARGNFKRLVRLVRSRAPLPLGAATAPRMFIGIDNLADAVVCSIGDEQAANQVFLIGDAEATSTVDLVHRIAGAMGRRIWTPRVPPSLLRLAFRAAGRERDWQRLFDPLELDIGRIRGSLGWSPPVSLEEGLRRALRGAR